ncbi:hypothetical protein C2G38_2211483 [Gigaspora rosea]|uniref:Uncharacterized protein n=1 Tax=Gigaspora rosea TaxID=44941 RepID=A0A397UE02_9GLOM|nr:hypothetical protein C2G38_2211483 [Gigaspora rosea]
MPLHVALFVAITSVEVFLPVNKQPQLFTPGELVFISGRYVVENLEQCITVSYTSVVNSENSNRKFDVSDVPECVPHCMISVTVNHKPKEVEDYIHFGVESVEYNSITGSNIKLGNTYFVLGLFKFSKFGQIIIEATDINYLRTSVLNYNAFENFPSVNSKHRSIIDIVADDVESVSAQTPLKCAESSAFSSQPENEKKLCNQPDCIELDDQDDQKAEPDFEDGDELDDDARIEDEECEEDLQSKNKKRVLE